MKVFESFLTVKNRLYIWTELILTKVIEYLVIFVIMLTKMLSISTSLGLKPVVVIVDCEYFGWYA